MIPRLLFIMASVLVLAGNFSVSQAATTGRLVLTPSGELEADGKVYRDTLTAEVDVETIRFDLGELLPSGATSGNWILELPVVMRTDWKPNLIASRCACRAEAVRSGQYTFDVKLSGMTPGGELILEAEFPAGTFDLPASQQFWLGLGRVSSILLLLAVVALLGSLGLLFWMARELSAFRKFTFSSTETDTPPNDLRPSMLSLLPSGKITPATMAGMLVDLASRGYLTIINKGETFLLAKDRQLDLTGPGFALGSAPDQVLTGPEIAKAKKEGVSVAEKLLLAKLFVEGAPMVSREELKSRLGRHLESAKIGKMYAEIYNEVTSHGFFIKNPHSIHLRYRAVGISAFFIGLSGFAASILFANQSIYLAIMWLLVSLSGYVITRMVYFLPLLTVMGQAELVRWAGFRAYLTNPQPLSQKVPTKRFFEYVPYAASWGVLPEWSRRFSGRKVRSPHWYLTSPAEQPVENLGKEISYLTGFVAGILAAIHEQTAR